MCRCAVSLVQVPLFTVCGFRFFVLSHDLMANKNYCVEHFALRLIAMMTIFFATLLLLYRLYFRLSRRRFYVVFERHVRGAVDNFCVLETLRTVNFRCYWWLICVFFGMRVALFTPYRLNYRVCVQKFGCGVCAMLCCVRLMFVVCFCLLSLVPKRTHHVRSVKRRWYWPPKESWTRNFRWQLLTLK